MVDALEKTCDKGHLRASGGDGHTFGPEGAMARVAVAVESLHVTGASCIPGFHVCNICSHTHRTPSYMKRAGSWASTALFAQVQSFHLARSNQAPTSTSTHRSTGFARGNPGENTASTKLRRNRYSFGALNFCRSVLQVLRKHQCRKVKRAICGLGRQASASNSSRRQH